MSKSIPLADGDRIGHFDSLKAYYFSPGTNNMRPLVESQHSLIVPLLSLCLSSHRSTEKVG